MKCQFCESGMRCVYVGGKSGVYILFGFLYLPQFFLKPSTIKKKFCPPCQFLLKFLQISTEYFFLGQRLEGQRVERLEGQMLGRLEGLRVERQEGQKVERCEGQRVER